MCPGGKPKTARVHTLCVAAALLLLTACVAQAPATPSPPIPPTAQPSTPTPTPTAAATSPAASMLRGRVDPLLVVEVNDAASVSPGTTLLPVQVENPRIVEVNTLGEVVWEYLIPGALKRYTNPGFDVELLPNNNVLYVLPGNGVYEIERSGRVVWSYLTTKISHDADRLPNGNTILVFGNSDTKADAQVVEVDPRGQRVWTWYARDHFDKPPYSDISDEGWTHTNAVQRFSNGNTQISLRNFRIVVEVDPQGAVVKTLGEGILDGAHDPTRLSNGNLLAASQNMLPENRGKPQRAVELDGATGAVVWEFPMPFASWPVRDANRLSNGNTLITGSTAIVEVTPQKNVVWRLRLNKTIQPGVQSAGLGFYKAERIGTPISP